jgi:predicted Zn-dependent protease
MNKKYKFLRLRMLSLCLCILLLSSTCDKVPYTGRSRLTLVSETTLVDLAKKEYRTMLSQSKIVRGTTDARRVEEIGRKLASVVERMQKFHKTSGSIPFEWEFSLVNDPQVNAWCMPGGKVCFYTGIMPFCQSDDALATVMGHEIAHALARHGNERLSQSLLAQAGGLITAFVLDLETAEQRELFGQAFGLAVNVGALLPFSRSHESEADRLGQIIMAAGGYDPAQSYKLWENMAKETKGSNIPMMLSSHPSHAQRIEELKAHAPVARRVAFQYQSSP